MEEMFKKFLYNSIGFASLTVKRVEELVDDLLAKGSLSKEEGERIIKNFKEGTSQSKDDFKKDMENMIQEMLRNMDVPTRQDMAMLEARISALEQRPMRGPEPDFPTDMNAM